MLFRSNRVGQLEFLYYLLTNKIERSKTTLVSRLRNTRNSRLHFSYAVMDGMFLERLHPGTISMRPSHVQSAVEFFTKNKLREAMHVMEYLQKRKKMSEEEFREIYPF